MSPEIFAAEAAAEASRPTQDEAYAVIPPKEHAGLEYTLLTDDMLLRNGRFANQRVSDVVKTVEGRDYVGQLWRTANPEIRRVLRRFFSD